MGRNRKRRGTKTRRRASSKSYAHTAQPQDANPNLIKSQTDRLSRKEHLRQTIRYAGRLIGYSAVLTIFCAATFLVPYSLRNPENTPFSMEIYILLLYFIYPLKFLMVWPMLWTAIIKKRVRNMIVWS